MRPASSLLLLFFAACGGVDLTAEQQSDHAAVNGIPVDTTSAGRVITLQDHASDETFDALPPDPYDGEDPNTTEPGQILILDECGEYPYSASRLLEERVGFGADTHGGDPSRIYYVTSLANSGAGTLRTALESAEPWWVVFDVEGVIDLGSDDIDVRSYKTVDGRGRNITIRGKINFDPGVHDIILTDLKITYPPNNNDVIAIYGIGGATPDVYTTRNIWFHHLELTDGGDGLLDVRGGTNITVSWSWFHYHVEAMLLGSDSRDDPSPGMRLTMHHNFFDRVTRRAPGISYGWIDYFNNYQYQWFDYGAASLRGAQFLSESNIYEAMPGVTCSPDCVDPSPSGQRRSQISKQALTTNAEGASAGFVRSTGDVLRNDALVTVNQSDRVFTRAAYYDAVVDPADDLLVQKITTEAGPRRMYCRH